MHQKCFQAHATVCELCAYWLLLGLYYLVAKILLSQIITLVGAFGFVVAAVLFFSPKEENHYCLILSLRDVTL